MTNILKMKNLTRFDKRILSAARKEFEINGYYKANIDHIAGALEIGKGTIYRHFKSKMMLFAYVIINIFLEAGKAINRLLPDSLFETRFESFIDQAVHLNSYAGKCLRVFLEEQAGNMEKVYHDPGLRKIYGFVVKEWDYFVFLLKDIIEQGKNEGKLQPDIDAGMAAAMTITTIYYNQQSFFSMAGSGKKPGIEKPFMEKASMELKKYIYRALGYQNSNSIQYFRNMEKAIIIKGD